MTKVFIVDQSNNMMILLKVDQPLAVDEITLYLKIEGSCIKVSKRRLYSNIFNTVDLFFHHKHYIE